MKYDKLERLALDMGYARNNIINPAIQFAKGIHEL
jgi:hypothetical protein